ncbi:MAG: hypothetical protein GY874_21830 [Desulfobacteraceae bacterium]|nr:hypothetical protein [Desulfobacteraceae bacterium]
MINPIGSSLMGLKAFQKKMDITSNNIANVNTNEFKKSRAVMQEGSQGGVTVSAQKINTPGVTRQTIRDGKIAETESSNVDLTEELTEMIPTKSAHSANAKALRTSDQMLGSLMDILG